MRLLGACGRVHQPCTHANNFHANNSHENYFWFSIAEMAEIEPTYIDVLIAEPDSRVMLIGECKYRKGFDETFEVEDMDRKRDLIKGYHATDLYLFSRYRVAESTTVKYSTRADVHLMDLGELYAR